MVTNTLTWGWNMLIQEIDVPKKQHISYCMNTSIPTTRNCSKKINAVVSFQKHQKSKIS